MDMRKLIFGSSVFLILIGALLWAYLKVVPSAADKTVLGFSQEEVSWSVSASFKLFDLIESFRPEEMAELRRAEERIIKHSPFSRLDRSWWRQHFSSITVGEVKLEEGRAPFALLAANKDPQSILESLRENSALVESKEGRLFLISRADCTQKEFYALKVSGNVVALYPEEMGEKFQEALKGVSEVSMFQALSAQGGTSDVVRVSGISAESLDWVKRASLTVSASIMGRLRAQLKAQVADTKRAEAFVKASEKFFPELFFLEGPTLRAQLSPSEIWEKWARYQNDLISEVPLKPFTQADIDLIPEDTLVDEKKLYFYPSTVSENELWSTECRRTTFSFDDWTRLVENPRGSYLRGHLKLCLKEAFRPVLGELAFTNLVVKTPAPDLKACGLDLNSKGVSTTEEFQDPDFYLRRFTFGVRPNFDTSTLNGISGELELNLPEAFEEKKIPFVAPFTYEVKFPKGYLIISAEKNSSYTVDVTLKALGEVPTIYAVRATSAMGRQIQVTPNLLQSKVSPTSEILRADVHHRSFAIRGQPVELQIVMEKSRRLSTEAFTIPAVIPPAPPALGKTAAILTSEVFEKKFLTPQYEKLLDGIYSRFVRDVKDSQSMLPNLSTAVSPFRLAMHPKDDLYKNMIRIFFLEDLSWMLQHEQPIELTMTRARTSDGIELGSASKLWTFALGWQEWSQGGKGFKLDYFEEHLDRLPLKEDTHLQAAEGLLKLRASQSAEVSDQFPVDIRRSHQFQDFKISPVRVGTDYLSVIVEGPLAQEMDWFLVAYDREGKLLESSRGAGARELDLVEVVVKTKEIPAAFKIVKASRLKKVYEFPFRFEAPKDI